MSPDLCAPPWGAERPIALQWGVEATALWIVLVVDLVVDHSRDPVAWTVSRVVSMDFSPAAGVGLRWVPACSCDHMRREGCEGRDSYLGSRACWLGEMDWTDPGAFPLMHAVV